VGIEAREKAVEDAQAQKDAQAVKNVAQKDEQAIKNVAQKDVAPKDAVNIRRKYLLKMDMRHVFHDGESHLVFAF
tara:strand:+ start:101 stop:325 length:225 start_codon:yes stop_codon:yes gene_type:complete